MKTRCPSKSPVLLPWFLSRNTHRKIQQLFPHIYHKRFHTYFQLYGCIRCQNKNRLYYSNGLCRNCSSLLSDRLRRCDRLMADEYREASTPPSNQLLRQITSARALLADLASTKRAFFAKRKTNSDRPQPITLRVNSSRNSPSRY